jgi:hypothetical protein
MSITNATQRIVMNQAADHASDLAVEVAAPETKVATMAPPAIEKRPIAQFDF